jgi:hypothetical protein
MKPRSLIVFVIVMGLRVIVQSPQAVAGSNASSAAFKVEASIDKNSLQKSRGCFLVNTKITNSGYHDEGIVVWTNYAWSWVTDNAEITLNTSAAQNVSSHITLKPNQNYTAKLNVCSTAAHDKPITFRVGFVPRAELPASGQEVEKWSGIFWSNAVTLNC